MQKIKQIIPNMIQPIIKLNRPMTAEKIPRSVIELGVRGVLINTHVK
jgi:hypothetical protein